MRKNIVIVYCGQVGMAHSHEEAKNVIESFRSYGRRNGDLLVVSTLLDGYLAQLFSYENVPLKRWRTKNCGCKDIVFYEALADTLEEHQRIYKDRCEREKAERIARAEEYQHKLYTWANEPRRGWYGCRIEVNALNQYMKPRFLEFTGEVLADSIMDAYNKACAQMPDFCASKELVFSGMDPLDYNNVYFLGMKMDGGFSVDAWEEAKSTGKI